MRRCLSILLLVLMPFQFSWAAVATYCEHESGTRSQHFGHHEHEHEHQHQHEREHEHEHEQQQPAGEPSEASKAQQSAALGGALDMADCHFHCQCAADLPAAMVVPMVIGSHPRTDWTAVDAVAPVLSRPERPQWVDHA